MYVFFKRNMTDCTSLLSRFQENGTVNVLNSCQVGDRNIAIQGTASPADEIYGDEGVFRVQFPQQPPPECPGPNYIVQCNSSLQSRAERSGTDR